MIRRDFIEAEIQKLSQILAKILGLKGEGNLDEAIEISNQTLLETFELDKHFLENNSVEEFEAIIQSRKYSAEKLNMLGQILFESSYPFQDTPECLAIMHKTAFHQMEWHQSPRCPCNCLPGWPSAAGAAP